MKWLCQTTPIKLLWFIITHKALAAKFIRLRHVKLKLMSNEKLF